MLTKYKRYLKECYNARPLALADKYLPTLEAPYINLAMIESKPYDTQQKDLFTKRTLHGGVDQILQSKTPISMVDLFSSNNSSKPVRFILVEGPPGIGKSTFTWELCRNHWEEFLNLDQYVQDPSITLQCLYESQNTALLPHYFVGNHSKEVAIGQLAQLYFPGIHKFCTSYDCYALSYCLAHYSDEFNLYLGITIDEDIILVETFLRGLADHSKNTIPSVYSG